MWAVKTKTTSDIEWNPGRLVRIHHDCIFWEVLLSFFCQFMDGFFAFFKYHQVRHHEKVHQHESMANRLLDKCNLSVEWYSPGGESVQKGSNRQHLEPLLHLEEDNNHNNQHDRAPHKGDRMAICQLSFREGPWPNMARRPKQRKGDEQVATTAKDGKASAGWLTARLCHRYINGYHGIPHPLNNSALPGKPYKHYHGPRADCLLAWGKYLNL